MIATEPDASDTTPRPFSLRVTAMVQEYTSKNKFLLSLALSAGLDEVIYVGSIGLAPECLQGLDDAVMASVVDARLCKLDDAMKDLESEGMLHVFGKELTFRKKKWEIWDRLKKDTQDFSPEFRAGLDGIYVDLIGRLESWHAQPSPVLQRIMSWGSGSGRSGQRSQRSSGSRSSWGTGTGADGTNEGHSDGEESFVRSLDTEMARAR